MASRSALLFGRSLFDSFGSHSITWNADFYSLSRSLRLSSSRSTAAGSAPAYARLISPGSRRIGSKRHSQQDGGTVIERRRLCAYILWLIFAYFHRRYLSLHLAFPTPAAACGSPLPARPTAALGGRQRRNVQNRKKEHRKTNKTKNQITQKI